MIVRYLVTIEAQTERKAHEVFGELMACAEPGGIDQYIDYNFALVTQYLGKESTQKEHN